MEWKEEQRGRSTDFHSRQVAVPDMSGARSGHRPSRSKRSPNNKSRPSDQPVATNLMATWVVIMIKPILIPLMEDVMECESERL